MMTCCGDDDVGSQVDPLSHPHTMSAYHLLADPCLSSLLRDSNVFYEVSTVRTYAVYGRR